MKRGQPAVRGGPRTSAKPELLPKLLSTPAETTAQPSSHQGTVPLPWPSTAPAQRRSRAGDGTRGPTLGKRSTPELHPFPTPSHIRALGEMQPLGLSGFTLAALGPRAAAGAGRELSQEGAAALSPWTLTGLFFRGTVNDVDSVFFATVLSRCGVFLTMLLSETGALKPRGPAHLPRPSVSWKRTEPAPPSRPAEPHSTLWCRWLPCGPGVDWQLCPAAQHHRRLDCTSRTPREDPDSMCAGTTMNLETPRLNRNSGAISALQVR